ncbi:hypothetical protein, partial [Lactobacillus gallinarum]
KDQFSLFKNKNRQKKTVKQLKLRVGLIVFQYLRVSFFPDTFFSLQLLRLADDLRKVQQQLKDWCCVSK